MKIMDNFDYDLSSKQKEFEEPLEKLKIKIYLNKKMNLKRKLQKLFILIHLLQKYLSFYKRSKL